MAVPVQAGGSAQLEKLLAHNAEEAKPEFLRQRPKYYYYNQWMRDRIAEHCGRDLPEPIVVKMLDMEAGELDLILNYPKAAQQQVRPDKPSDPDCRPGTVSTQHFGWLLPRHPFSG